MKMRRPIRPFLLSTSPLKSDAIAVSAVGVSGMNPEGALGKAVVVPPVERARAAPEIRRTCLALQRSDHFAPRVPARPEPAAFRDDHHDVPRFPILFSPGDDNA